MIGTETEVDNAVEEQVVAAAVMKKRRKRKEGEVKMGRPAKNPVVVVREDVNETLEAIYTGLNYVLNKAHEVKEFYDNLQDQEDLDLKVQEASEIINQLAQTEVDKVKKEYENRIAVMEMELSHVKELHKREFQYLHSNILLLTEEKDALENQLDENNLFQQNLLSLFAVGAGKREPGFVLHTEVNPGEGPEHVV